VPAHVKDKIKIIYEFYGDAVTLIETRPPWDGSDRPWTKCKVAKFKFNRLSKKWTLYCFDRNSKAHEFQGCPPSSELLKLVIIP